MVHIGDHLLVAGAVLLDAFRDHAGILDVFGCVQERRVEQLLLDGRVGFQFHLKPRKKFLARFNGAFCRVSKLFAQLAQQLVVFAKKRDGVHGATPD